LVIGDFCPTYPQKRKYHHKLEADAYTYKIDCGKMFKSFGTYKEIYKFRYDYFNPCCNTINCSDIEDFYCVQVLKKDLYGGYQEV
jgi:hypothetical protein